MSSSKASSPIVLQVPAVFVPMAGRLQGWDGLSPAEPPRLEAAIIPPAPASFMASMASAAVLAEGGARGNGK